jgi:hypothetical protein
MSLLKSKINLYQKLQELINCANNEIIIFSPYIKCKSLSLLLNDLSGEISVNIITTLKPADIAFGSSDIELYPYCKKNNYKLLINNKIHLKVILINNMEQGYIGSANISKSGLAYDTNYNFEIGAIIDSFDLDDKFYFDKIIQDSFVMNEDYYNKAKKECEKLEKPLFEDEFDIPITLKQKEYLLSSLPMSDSVLNLYQVYSRNNNDEFSTESLRSANHDINLYNIPEGLNKNDFIITLKDSFLNHPFIVEYLKYIGESKHFGEVSHWLHNKVTTVPTPRRYVVKEFQVRMNEFIKFLSPDYDIDIPGQRSQRLFRIQD